MHKIPVLIPSLVLAVTILALPASAKIRIRVGTQTAKGAPLTKAMEDIAKTVKKKTRSKVRFKFYFNGTLGNEQHVVQRIKASEIDGGLFTAIGLGQILPKTHILGDLPPPTTPNPKLVSAVQRTAPAA